MKRTKARKKRPDAPAGSAGVPPATRPRRPRSQGSLRLLDLSIAPDAPPRWPSISACLIVKDESANLGPCIGSLGDLASEVIVVDTGSSDGTVEVARALGASVYRHPWTDDFAAARNQSLRHATKEWVFWLDADDRLSRDAVAQLKRVAASGQADAYACMVGSRKPNGSQDVVEHIRLFRNRLGIRFSGAIHETVLHDLTRLGLRLARTNVTIEHVGYASPEAIPRKCARNLALIERELAAHPDRVDLIFYRGHSRRGLGDVDGAEADMREYLRRTKAGVQFDWTRFWAYAALLYILQSRSDLEGMERHSQEALVEFPGHPHFLVELARVQLALGRSTDALHGLRAALDALQAAQRGLLPSKASIEAGLAECHRALGETERAIHWAERARAHDPASDQIAELLARLYVEAGRETQADELLAGTTAARVLAETTTRSDTSSQQLQMQTRGLAFLARKEHLRAAEAFAEAAESAPTNPDNYRYLAVALEGLGQQQEALEAWRLAAHWQGQ